jgi:hypothetical protein
MAGTLNGYVEFPGTDEADHGGVGGANKEKAN